MGLHEKLELLQETYIDESELDLILDKLLDVTLSQHRQRLARYQRELHDFELRYGMSSSTFYHRFESGDMGDDMDYFEWAGLWELAQELKARIGRLEQIA